MNKTPRDFLRGITRFAIPAAILLTLSMLAGIAAASVTTWAPGAGTRTADQPKTTPNASGSGRVFSDGAPSFATSANGTQHYVFASFATDGGGSAANPLVPYAGAPCASASNPDNSVALSNGLTQNAEYITRSDTWNYAASSFVDITAQVDYAVNSGTTGIFTVHQAGLSANWNISVGDRVTVSGLTMAGGTITGASVPYNKTGDGVQVTQVDSDLTFELPLGSTPSGPADDFDAGFGVGTATIRLNTVTGVTVQPNGLGTTRNNAEVQFGPITEGVGAGTGVTFTINGNGPSSPIADLSGTATQQRTAIANAINALNNVGTVTVTGTAGNGYSIVFDQGTTEGTALTSVAMTDNIAVYNVNDATTGRGVRQPFPSIAWVDGDAAVMTAPAGSGYRSPGTGTFTANVTKSHGTTTLSYNSSQGFLDSYTTVSGTITRNNYLFQTASAHGLTAGSLVSIAGTGDKTVGRWPVQRAPSTTTFVATTDTGAQTTHSGTVATPPYCETVYETRANFTNTASPTLTWATPVVMSNCTDSGTNPAPAASCTGQASVHGEFYSLASDGADVYVVYAPTAGYYNKMCAGSPRPMYVRISHDYGATWNSSPILITASSSRVGYPTIAAGGGHAYIATTENLSSFDPSNGAMGKVSVWHHDDLLADTSWVKTDVGDSTSGYDWGYLPGGCPAPGGYSGSVMGIDPYPGLAVAGKWVGLIWTYSNSGGIRIKVSKDAGATWSTSCGGGGPMSGPDVCTQIVTTKGGKGVYTNTATACPGGGGNASAEVNGSCGGSSNGASGTGDSTNGSGRMVFSWMNGECQGGSIWLSACPAAPNGPPSGVYTKVWTEQGWKATQLVSCFEGSADATARGGCTSIGGAGTYPGNYMDGFTTLDDWYGTVTTGAQAEVQSLTINATGGTFTMSYNGGASTAPQAFNVPLATLDPIVEGIIPALCDVTTGGVVGAYTFTFVDAGGGCPNTSTTIVQLAVNPGSLTGGTAGIPRAYTLTTTSGGLTATPQGMGVIWTACADGPPVGKGCAESAQDPGSEVVMKESGNLGATWGGDWGQAKSFEEVAANGSGASTYISEYGQLIYYNPNTNVGGNDNCGAQANGAAAVGCKKYVVFVGRNTAYTIYALFTETGTLA